MASTSESAATSSKESGNDTPKIGGIPKATFVDDVDAFMQEPGNESAEVVMKRFDELYRKYKFMEANLVHKKKRLRSQIPDIKKSLDMVTFLKSKQANVMLEYPIEEALELLRTNLSSAQSSLTQAQEDLDTIRDQTTTLEVGMARVYNWDVGQRKKSKT